MTRLDRYVLREVLGPTLVGFLAYTGFMLLRGFLQFSNLVLQSDEPLRDTGAFLLCSLPHVVVLTIPVAFLLGLLVGIARLSADSELIALRASGLDLARLYRPLAFLSSILFGITLFVMVEVVPRTNRVLYDMKLQLSTFAITQRLQPGVFSPEFSGRRIYVDRASSDRRSLEGLIVSDLSNPGEGERITIARTGRLELEESEGRLWLRLDDAVTHHVHRDPERYDRSSYATQRILLTDANPKERVARLRVDKQLREQTMPELLERGRSARDPIERRLTWVEIHKKVALPAACLVFALLGLPLGVVNRRGGRAAGFAVSIGIVLLYYILLAWGESRAIEGQLEPWVAMWLPNFALLLLGITALIRLRRDLPVLPDFQVRFSGSSPGSDQGDGDALTGLAPRLASSGEPPARQPRLARRRERRSRTVALLIDRYVAGRFLRTLSLVIASFLTLYVLIDYMEISDDIAKNQPSLALLLAYFHARLAPILLDLVPFAFLVSALVTAAGLVRSSETTAMLAHGISVFRSMGSLVLLAIAFGGGLFWFADRVVPESALNADQYRARILKERVFEGSKGGWIRGDGGRFFSARVFDAASHRVSDVSFMEVDPSTFALLRKGHAENGLLAPSGLILENGWIRSSDAGGQTIFLRKPDRFQIEAPEVLERFRARQLDPRQMSASQLLDFIEIRKKAGADTAALSTNLHQRFATSFAALILVLVGLPFAFRHGRKGAVAGIGIAILVGLGYVVLAQMLLGKAGETGSLPPALAAWGGNVVFGLAAAYGLLGLRS